MNVSKDLIRKNFGSAVNSYNSSATVQSKAALELVNMVCSNHDISDITSVLDIGSGTGEIIRNLKDCGCNASYFANDISDQVIAYLDRYFTKQVATILGDAECYEFNHSYDMVISNLCFQWFANIQRGLQKLFLCADKIFAFTTLVEGNFQLWHDVHKTLGLQEKLHKYCTRDYMESMCTELADNALCHCNSYSLKFLNVREFMYHLHCIGANNPSSGYSLLEIRQLIENFPEDFEINYEIFYSVIIK